jgi:eukaryotic-like serine/threonine-protein kinase
MKTKKLLIPGLMLLLAIALGGCATGLTASSWPGVTADETHVYLAGGPYVYAVNVDTGVEAWRFPAKASTANPFYATPALTPDGSQLIVGGFDHKLYSLNPASGAQNWVFEQAKDRWIGGPLVTSDAIYAANADYKLYALDFSGNPLWVTPFSGDQAIWGSPVTDGTNIYFGTLGRHVYAVNAQTGQQVWVQKVDGAILGSPTLVSEKNYLYVGTYGGVLARLSTLDGSILEQETASSWIWAAPAQDGTYLYTGDGDGTFYGFPINGTGQPWTQKLNGTITGSPLVLGETIIVGTEAGTLYFMDTNGQNVRSVYTDSGKIYASPVALASGTIILVAPTAGSSSLIALDLNGSTRWTFTPAK